MPSLRPRLGPQEAENPRRNHKLPDDFGIDLLRLASNGRAGECLIILDFAPDRQLEKMLAAMGASTSAPSPSSKSTRPIR